MNSQDSHLTRSTQKGTLFQIRLARKGATRARLSWRMGLSQMTQFETSIMLRDAPGQLAIVRVPHSRTLVGTHITPLKETVLRPPDIRIAAVIENKDLNRQLVVADREQFLGIELEAAISCHANYPLTSVPHAGSHGQRQAPAHCSPATGDGAL